MPTASPQHFFDKSQGLFRYAEPHAITAYNQNVWFTDPQTGAIGSVPISGGPSQEYEVHADAWDITADNRGSMIYSERSGSSYGSFNPATSKYMQVALQPFASPLQQSGIAADSSGRVYVAVGTPSSISGQGIYTANGVLHQGAGVFDPSAVLWDSYGYIWVTDVESGFIQAMLPNGTIVSTIQTHGKPQALANYNGRIYAVDAEGTILKIDQSLFFATVFARPSCAAAYIASGPGTAPINLWFTEPACHKIGHIDANGSMTEMVNQAGPTGQPDHITVDQNGHVWFTDSALHKIFEYIP